jgi:hypothetical protein
MATNWLATAVFHEMQLSFDGTNENPPSFNRSGDSGLFACPRYSHRPHTGGTGMHYDLICGAEHPGSPRTTGGCH